MVSGRVGQQEDQPQYLGERVMGATTMASLYQDQVPLSLHTRDELEKMVTDQSLHYCDTTYVASSRHQMYQVRAGMIHHRLASLYHHSFRSAQQITEVRLKKLKQLSELHYVKATNLFIILCMFAQAIRTILERAGLLEASLVSSKSDVGKYKILLQILDIILETEAVVNKIVNKDGDDFDQEELDEEKKMTEIILQRLQFTLLSMVKCGNMSSKSKKKGDKKSSGENNVVKDVYGSTLKCSVNSENFVKELHKLLLLVSSERVNM